MNEDPEYFPKEEYFVIVLHNLNNSIDHLHKLILELQESVRKMEEKLQIIQGLILAGSKEAASDSKNTFDSDPSILRNEEAALDKPVPKCLWKNNLSKVRI